MVCPDCKGPVVIAGPVDNGWQAMHCDKCGKTFGVKVEKPVKK